MRGKKLQTQIWVWLPIFAALLIFTGGCETAGVMNGTGVNGQAKAAKAGARKHGGWWSRSEARGARRGRGKTGLSMGPQSTSNDEVVVTLPADRCKSGSIVFGNTRCVAMGRGLTRWSDPKSDRWQKGHHSNGTPCWFLKAGPPGYPDRGKGYVRGATPVTDYRTGAIRYMGGDKKHWGQAGVRIHGRTPNRAGFVIHSVAGYTGPETAEKQSGFGCVRIPQHCMTKFRKFVREGKRKVNVEVNEVGT